MPLNSPENTKETEIAGFIHPEMLCAINDERANFEMVQGLLSAALERKDISGVNFSVQLTEEGQNTIALIRIPDLQSGWEVSMVFPTGVPVDRKVYDILLDTKLAAVRTGEAFR